MNLVEVLLAGLLFSLASAGSLGLMAGLGRSLQQGAEAEAAAEQLELELHRSEAAVQAAAQQGQGTDLACDQPEQLLTSLLAEPAGIGVPGPGPKPRGPIGRLGGDGRNGRPTQPAARREGAGSRPGAPETECGRGRWQRQRLFSAAAYGFCPVAQGVQP
jgi:hypothetical protein